MDAKPEGFALLALAARKGLIAEESAVTLRKSIESGVHAPGAKPVAAALVEQGHITAAQADLLLDDFARSQGPKIIGGHRLVSKLGQGGMGAVYKAVQLSMQREVAIKVLTPHLARDKEFVERFVREARAAGKVQHANVIGCYDVGVDKGTPYMSLELVAGGDALQRCKAAGGRLDEREALTIIRDCARGLAAIDKAGLIHRDIKPANIFLTEEGVAKLADLGLARSSSGDDKMTQTGATVGSPAYMSPEQAKGVHDLDIRTDIYSLGASLFHLVCGDPPFTATSVFATVAKVINDPLPDPRTFNPALSSACIAIMRRALEKNRSDRFLTPEALLEACEMALGGTLATQVVPRRPPQRATPHHVHNPRPSAPVRNKVPLAAYIGGGIAALVVIGVLISQLGGGSPAAIPPVASLQALPIATTPPLPAQLPGTVTPALTVAATDPVSHPVREHIRERIEERREERREANTPPPAVVAAAVRGEPTIAPEIATPAQPALPAWADTGMQVLEQILTGDVEGAARTARSLPREQRDAVEALARAQSEMPQTWLAHKAAIIAAKPALPSLMAGVTVIDLTDRNVMFRDARSGAEAGLPYSQLKADDIKILRAIVAADNPTPADTRRFFALDLTSLDQLMAGDTSDPMIAGLQSIGAVKHQILAQAVAQAEAERRAVAETARTSATTRSTGVFAQRILRHLAEISQFQPQLISGPITSDIVLRDFVVLTKGARLQGGRLIPTAGAVVINLSEGCGYQPVVVRGLPFISIAPTPFHTTCGGRVEDGDLFSNAIFFGNAAIDGKACGNFSACSFIGSHLPLAFPLGEIHSPSGQTRPGQVRNSDFVHLTIKDATTIAATDRCYFEDTTIERGRTAFNDLTISAWDARGALQAALTTSQSRIQIRSLPGQPATLLGADTATVGAAIDDVLKVWGPRLQEWSK